MRFWVGGWGPDHGGEASGIVALTAGEADSPLAGGSVGVAGEAVVCPSPSWLAAHPSLGVVYAALEGEGRVAAFRQSGDAALRPLGEPVETGEAVCHIAVAPDGSRLIASCWGDGRVVQIPLAADGHLGKPAIAAAAVDPYAGGSDRFGTAGGFGSDAAVFGVGGGGGVAVGPGRSGGVGDRSAGERGGAVLGASGRGERDETGGRGDDVFGAGGRDDWDDAGGQASRGEAAERNAAAGTPRERAAAAGTDAFGAVDLSALVSGGEDPTRIARMLSGEDPDADARALAELLGHGGGDPFDDPAVRGILAAAEASAASSGRDAAALRASGAGSSPAGAPPESSDPERSAADSANAERVSRAHCAVFLPGGRVATTDLGFDLVRIWRLGSAGLVADHEVVLPRGSGPRHLLLHPSGHLHVLTEHSAEVFTLAADRAGRYRLLGGVPASAAAVLGDAGAEIAMSRDGSFLYAGLRGSDTIAVLRVKGNGETIAPVALAESGVAWPRHHAVVRDTLLVAGQRSHEVASLTLDDRTGAPSRPRHRVEVPTPTHILPTR